MLLVHSFPGSNQVRFTYHENELLLKTPAMCFLGFVYIFNTFCPPPKILTKQNDLSQSYQSRTLVVWYLSEECSIFCFCRLFSLCFKIETEESFSILDPDCLHIHSKQKVGQSWSKLVNWVLRMSRT